MEILWIKRHIQEGRMQKSFVLLLLFSLVYTYLAKKNIESGYMSLFTFAIIFQAVAIAEEYFFNSYHKNRVFYNYPIARKKYIYISYSLAFLYALANLVMLLLVCKGIVALYMAMGKEIEPISYSYILYLFFHLVFFLSFMIFCIHVFSPMESFTCIWIGTVMGWFTMKVLEMYISLFQNQPIKGVVLFAVFVGLSVYFFLHVSKETIQNKDF